MEFITKDILELESILELYNWVQNYDNSKVPTKRSIFLEVKSKLNLKIVNKNNLLTPKTTGLLKNGSSRACAKHGENLSEKRYYPQRIQNYMGIGSDLCGKSIERRSRPSTLCSIYPISAFSRIHETLLDASYRNSRICDYNNSSSDGGESSEEYRSYMGEETGVDYNLNSKCQEIKRKSLKKESEKSIVDNKIVFDETECGKAKYNFKFSREIDIKSLSNLIIYLKNIIRSRSGSSCMNDDDYLRSGNNFCFLTLWKKIEESTQQKVGELNEEITVWQQLRDVLLLTGMSLKYPTWSGEQLTNIITRICPKKILNLIIENNRSKLQSNGDKNEICYQGLSELYYTFIENSKNVFDLFSVSKLIEESLTKYINLIKTLKYDQILSGVSKEIENLKIENNQLSSEEKDFLEVLSTYSTCGEYGFDEDGYASVLETDYNEFSGNNIMVDSNKRESKLIDSLGLFVNLSDVKRPLIDDYASNKVNSSISFSNGSNIENSNTTMITSTTTTANNNERNNTAKLNSVADLNDDNNDEFEFNIGNSVQQINENIINLGISRKLFQDLINETLIKNSSSSSLVYIEKGTLIDACRIIDDCIYHSNSILEYCHKNKVVKNKNSSRIALIWFFISIIIILFIIFVGKHNPAIELIEKTAFKSNDQYFKSGGIPIRSLNSKENLELHGKDNSHSKTRNNLIKASDCILSKDTNQVGVNSDICNVIGDITVIEKCFTNINLSTRN